MRQSVAVREIVAIRQIVSVSRQIVAMRKSVSRFSWLPALALVAFLFATGCGQGTEEQPSAGGGQEPAKTAGESSGADEVELEFWRSVKDSEHTDDLWSYLERYPQGTFADLAKKKIERLAKGESGTEEPAPAAAPPTAAPPAQRRSRQQIVRDVIRRKLAKFSEPRAHIAPDIPRRKLENAAQIHGFDTSKVLFLYDDGFSGGGKTGFCLTDRKVYWRFVSGSPAYYLDFEDIEQVRVRKKKFLLNGYDVSVTMANDPPRAAEVFADMLETIRDELR